MIFSHPTSKACTSPYMQYYFKWFSALHSSEVTFSFMIKKSRQKAIEIKITFFHSLGNPKGRTLDHVFTYPLPPSAHTPGNLHQKFAPTLGLLHPRFFPRGGDLLGIAPEGRIFFYKRFLLFLEFPLLWQELVTGRVLIAALKFYVLKENFSILD